MGGSPRSDFLGGVVWLGGAWVAFVCVVVRGFMVMSICPCAAAAILVASAPILKAQLSSSVGGSDITVSVA